MGYHMTELEGKNADRIAAALEQIARGGSPAKLDGVFAAMVDGENTTKLFLQFMPLALEESSRFVALERFFKLIGAGWADKVYTLRGPDWRVSNGATALTPLADLADKQAAQLCTDTTAPVHDWADDDPMTWYCRANALSLANGDMNVLAIEGIDDTFDITGNLAPVYTFRLALWQVHFTDGSYEYKTFATVQQGGMRPWAAAVRPDNSIRPMVWQATFGGSKTSDGKLTSGAGNLLAINTSATAGLTAARKWDAYEGVYSETDTDVILDLWQLRHFDLENSGILEGCTSYYLDYTVAMAEDEVRSVVLTAAQGANILIGSTLDVGTEARNGSIARARVLLKENFTQGETEYTRVFLDVAEDFNVTEGAHAATMPWFTGTTEALPGRKDGSIYHLTNGKTPARIAGVELLDGAYAVGLDPLWNSDYNAERSPASIYTVYACRDSEKQAGSITANYEAVATFTSTVSGWQYVKHFEVRDDGMQVPDALGGSGSTYMKSAFHFGGSSGVRAPWVFGSLNYGALFGLACAAGYFTPGDADWDERPRLAGSGKKRGEWAA